MRMKAHIGQFYTAMTTDNMQPNPIKQPYSTQIMSATYH